MPDIFLSYAREDQPRIDPLVQALTDHGWSVFWDRRIPAGKDWRSHIGQALSDARCVIVAWSERSVDSHWVCEEADDAKARGLLVPVLLEAILPPIGFRTIQAADLSSWQPGQGSAAFDQLLGDIGAMIGGGDAAAVGVMPDPSDPCEGSPVMPGEAAAPPAAPSRMATYAIVGAVLLVIVAAWLAMRPAAGPSHGEAGGTDATLLQPGAEEGATPDAGTAEATLAAARPSPPMADEANVDAASPSSPGASDSISPDARAAAGEPSESGLAEGDPNAPSEPSPPAAIGSEPTFWLQVQELNCKNSEGRGLTNSGTDEPYIEVNGRNVWGPTAVRCPTRPAVRLDLRPIELTEEENVLELRESDEGGLSRDDSLGKVEVSRAKGNGKWVFTQRHAHYVLTWAVTATHPE